MLMALGGGAVMALWRHRNHYNLLLDISVDLKYCTLLL